VTKDNLLYASVGVLLGFIAGYMLHEMIMTRQPPRLTPELRAQIVARPGEDGGGPMQQQAAPPPGPAAPTGAAAGGPPMAEVQELQARLQQNPNDTEAMLRLANLNFDIRNWSRAQELYIKYLELNPQDVDVMTDLGISYRETRQFDQALQMFAKAKAADPNHWQAYYNEVVVLAFDLKRLDEANQSLAKLQALQPDNPNVAQLAEAVAKQRNAA
jgi:cytochrome c-type biogenesis protein CcmH/NrfG